MKTGPLSPLRAPPDARPTEQARAVASAPTASAPARTPPPVPDFTHMTKADYVAWGKSQFTKGQITLDDLFQVQFAGGDFDGTVNTDTAPHDFVGFFEGLIRNEIKAGRGDDKPQSMVPAYRHVLASMTQRLDRSV